MNELRHNGDLWIFGYGSIVWKVDFPVEESVCGFIKGWHRRFWQGSPDHRGVPGAVGRVVTLISTAHMDAYCQHDSESSLPYLETKTWGKVFRVSSVHVKEVLEHLDHREKAGYDRSYVDVHCKDGLVRKALVFIATPDNEDFLGPASIEDMAYQIAVSVGPSGSNREYFARILQSVRDMNVIDEHLENLEKGLEQYDRNQFKAHQQM